MAQNKTHKAYFIRLTIAGIVGITAILALCGIYPVKLMDIQFTAVLQRAIFDFTWIAVGLLAGILILTFLFGRFYCSTICPFGILQEFMALLFKKKGVLQKNLPQNLPLKYFIAALTFGALIGGSALIIRYIDPYTMFGSAISLTLVGLIFTFAVLALVFFKNRYFCINICPVGAVLGLISKISLNKIYIDKEKCVSCGLCAKSCPAGCINKIAPSPHSADASWRGEFYVDNETCVKCLKCLGECRKGAIKFGTQPVKFNPKRRELIISTTALVVLGGAMKAGIEIGKNFSKKVRDIILPAGAKNANRMANKCLNCNLCIENCPNKILTKADKNFPAVHIDYSKGKGYCEYNCNKCSQICPSGVIKRITLEEKQKTRIAMAAFNKEICTRCGLCAKICPVNAINLDEKNEPFLDGSKCIGCGKCAKYCPADAIEIFGVNEQG